MDTITYGVISVPSGTENGRDFCVKKKKRGKVRNNNKTGENVTYCR